MIELLALIVFLWIVMFWLKIRKLYEKTSKLPKLLGHLPVIGIAHKLFGNEEFQLRFLNEVSLQALKQDKPMGGWVGPYYYFIVVHLADVEYTQRKCIDKDDIRKYAAKLLGGSSLFAACDLWKQRRKIMLGAVSSKPMDSFVEVFSKHSDMLVRKLETDIGKEISTWELFNTYSFDSACEATFGVQFKSEETKKILNGMNRIMHLVVHRLFVLWYQPDWLYRFFAEGREHDNIVDMLHSFTDNAIKNIKEELEKLTPEEIKLRDSKNKSFVESLIDISGGEAGYSDVEIREEVLAILMAASDTTTITIGNTLTLLMKYPEIQDKVYQEMEDIFEGSQRSIVREDLVKMSYLEMVVKESLRLFPPVPYMVRKAKDDILIPSGYTIPKGSGIVQSMWAVLRDQTLWGDDADQFIPDRFLEHKNYSAFAPFSFGPRNCVGTQYAMSSLKTALANILRKYRVIGEQESSPIPNIRSKFHITVKAVDNYKMQFEYR